MNRGIWRVAFALNLLMAVVPLTRVNIAVADDAVVAICDETSFDAALASALSGGGTISFSCSGTLTFTGQKAINAPNVVVIDGANQITFDGGGATRLFQVDDGATLELHNLTLSNGTGQGGAVHVSSDGTLRAVGSTFSDNGNLEVFEGGAIDNDGGVIEVTNSTFNDNMAAYGGAIDNDPGTLTVANSTFNDNSAKFNAGAIYNGGGLTVTASTFTGNNANDRGGAIYNEDSLSVMASTLTGNSAGDRGGAIRNLEGTTTIASSIVALNTASTGNNCHNFDGSITSQGSNLIDDGGCNFTASDDIRHSENIDLEPLQDNGGPTRTMVPASTSDAIDNADCTLSTSADQRGVNRPQGSGCDIGAVERIQTGTYLLCASYYTGAVSSPLSGDCGSGTVEITPFDSSFCIDLYTGKLLYRFGRACNPPRVAHTMPDDGDLLTCVSLYTGANRWVNNHSQCSAYEVPNTIPATP